MDLNLIEIVQRVIWQILYNQRSSAFQIKKKYQRITDKKPFPGDPSKHPV